MTRKRKQKKSRKLIHHKGGKTSQGFFSNAQSPPINYDKERECFSMCDDMLNDQMKPTCKHECMQDYYYSKENMNCQPLIEKRNTCFETEGVSNNIDFDRIFCERSKKCMKIVRECRAKCSKDYNNVAQQNICMRNCRYPCSVEIARVYNCRDKQKRPDRYIYGGKRITRRRRRRKN